MISIAILGHGVVGSGVAAVLRSNAKGIAAKAGQPITVKRILDLRTSNFVLTEYFNIEIEENEKIVFTKNRVKGYVVERTGKFIPADEYDEENMSDEDIVYNTFK